MALEGLTLLQIFQRCQMIDEKGNDVLSDEDMQTVVDTVHQLDPLPHDAQLVLLLCVLCSS